MGVTYIFEDILVGDAEELQQVVEGVLLALHVCSEVKIACVEERDDGAEDRVAYVGYLYLLYLRLLHPHSEHSSKLLTQQTQH